MFLIVDLCRCTSCSQVQRDSYGPFAILELKAVCRGRRERPPKNRPRAERASSGHAYTVPAAHLVELVLAEDFHARNVLFPAGERGLVLVKRRLRHRRRPGALRPPNQPPGLPKHWAVSGVFRVLLNYFLVARVGPWTGNS